MVCCGQRVHQDCLQTWFMETFPSHVCPYCRNLFPWLPYVRRQGQTPSLRQTVPEQREVGELAAPNPAQPVVSNGVADRRARVEPVTDRTQRLPRRNPVTSVGSSVSSSILSPIPTRTMGPSLTVPQPLPTPPSSPEPSRAATQPDGSSLAHHRHHPVSMSGRGSIPARRRYNKVPTLGFIFRVSICAGLELTLSNLAPTGYRLGESLARLEEHEPAMAPSDE